MERIKVSDYIAEFIASTGVNYVFGVTGGSALHLIDSINRHKELSFVACHHEQSAAMAADGYARSSNLIGVAISTSGPGATNLLTGIAGAHFDSIPLLIITGQVSSSKMRGGSQVRQRGFQETDVVKMAKPITKFAVQLESVDQLPQILSEAFRISREGRPGPVLIDIPDDLQREFLDKKLAVTSTSAINYKLEPDVSIIDYAKIRETISSSKRPLIAVGAGVSRSGAEKEFNLLCQILKIPVVATWGAASIVEGDLIECVGTFGTHGNRHSNLAIQDSDLILSIGARLDFKSTGFPPEMFAVRAKKLVVDIDEWELKKLKKSKLTNIETFNSDAKKFIDSLVSELTNSEVKEREGWVGKIRELKQSTLAQDNLSRSNMAGDLVNPYRFFESLYSLSGSSTGIVLDTGCTVAWAMQTPIPNRAIKLFHDFNNTAMGWSIPASLGVALGGIRDVICVVGDGSLMFGLSDLIHLKKYCPNIKIYILNNGGYSMIRQSQDQWLNGSHIGSSTNEGLDFPNFKLLAASHGYEYEIMSENFDIDLKLSRIQSTSGAVICEVIINPSMNVLPIVKAGSALYDMDPPLLSITTEIGSSIE